MTIEQVIRKARDDIQVDKRSKTVCIACHYALNWRELYGSYTLANARVRYWRLLAVGEAFNSSMFDWDLKAFNIVDEAGPWEAVARRLVKHLKQLKEARNAKS